MISKGKERYVEEKEESQWPEIEPLFIHWRKQMQNIFSTTENVKWGSINKDPKLYYISCMWSGYFLSFW